VLILNPGRASRCLYTIFLPRVEDHGDDGVDAEARFRKDMGCVKEEISLILPGLSPVLLVGKPDCVKREGDAVYVYEFTRAKNERVSFYKLVRKAAQAAFYALVYEEKCKRTGQCKHVRAYVVFEVSGVRYTIELPTDAVGRARRWIAETVGGNIALKLSKCDNCVYRTSCNAKVRRDKIVYDREFALEVLQRAVAAGVPTKKPWYNISEEVKKATAEL